MLRTVYRHPFVLLVRKAARTRWLSVAWVQRQGLPVEDRTARKRIARIGLMAKSAAVQIFQNAGWAAAAVDKLD